MPRTIELPVTTYRISQNKPNDRYGSPAALPLAANEHSILVRVPLDRVPRDGVITEAILLTYARRADANGGNIRVRAPSEPWKASVKWATQPATGVVLDAVNPTSLADHQEIALVVTPWAITRSRNGLMLQSTTDLPSGIYLSGSSAARDKPVLVVTYQIEPDTPGGMVPDGGPVSVAAPILNYAGDEAMTSQRIEFSTNEGDTVSYDSGWLPATEGRYDPALDPGANPVLTDGGTGIYWRATTDGPDGQSAPGEWAYYEFDSLTAAAIVSPGATSIDGSPRLEWTATSQSTAKASFYRGSRLIDTSGWLAAGVREWVPSKAIPVPGVLGRFALAVRDNVPDRVAAEGAPTQVNLSTEFRTTLTGADTAIANLTATWDEPVPVITGDVLGGITPDEIGLFRDGVQVPLWASDGEAYLWAPYSEFVVDDAFALRDYTAEPRHQHTWQVYVKGTGVPSATGPAATGQFFTGSVWIINPRTGEQVEIHGYNDEPAVEQSTEENSVLHVPINGGLLVEPKRRRLTRLTKAGTIEGTVLNDDEDIFDNWVMDDSGLKYRLIFGKVNWSVIIGDYSPAEVFYSDFCGPDRVLVACTWYQRLADF